MYDKLLNKNVITLALVSLMTLGAAGTCEAQGIVSLVEEEKVVLPQDNTAEVVNETEDFGLEIDAELPDSLPEDEGVIPFDDDPIISPENATTDAPAEENNAASETEASKEAAEDNLNALEVNEDPALQGLEDDQTSEEAFDLGLETNLPEEASQNAPAGVNNLPAATNNVLPANAINVQPAQPSEPFANSVLSKIDNDLFSQMSDIEKQTTLLTLELRREKIRSEIDAVKAQRTKAEEEKIAAEEEKKRKEFEWKKEQEAKVYREQQLLKEKEIELEKIKQRKALTAYMNKMLEEKQSWIKENSELLSKLKKVEQDRNDIAENFKEKLNNLKTLSDKFVQSASSAKSNHDRTIANLSAQNVQLKKRLETEIAARQNSQNPFSANASNSAQTEDGPVNVNDEYAIMDISGKGNNLVAKLINKEGDSFSARKGTVLQTGHVVEEITPSYIMFNVNGLKQFLYIVDTIEPDKLASNAEVKKDDKEEKRTSSGESSLPSLGSGMFVK